MILDTEDRPRPVVPRFDSRSGATAGPWVMMAGVGGFVAVSLLLLLLHKSSLL